MARIETLLGTGAGAMLCALAAPAHARTAHAQTAEPAGAAAAMTTERAGLLYDQCLAVAGARASRANTPDAELYPKAKAECAALRATLLDGFDASSERADVFTMIDENRAKTLPASTRRQRELRRPQ